MHRGREREGALLTAGRLLSAAAGVAFAAALWLAGAAESVSAQASVTAEALFRAGRQASARGDHATACSKYRESYRVEQALGTLLNIAVCEEALGDLAGAWQHYQQVVHALPAGDERLSIARERLQALEQRLPQLTVVLAAGDPASTHIEIGLVQLSAASFDLPLPLNPGEHELRVIAPGHAPRSYPFALAEGEQRTLVVEPGEVVVEPPGEPATAPTPADAALSATPTATPTEVTATTAPAATPSPRPSDSGELQRVGGYLALGLGGVGLVTSGVTFGFVIDRKLTVDDHCQAGECDEIGDRAARSGRDLALASIVSLVVGVASTATGLYLLWTAPSPQEAASAAVGVQASLIVEPGRFGAALTGAF